MGSNISSNGFVSILWMINIILGCEWSGKNPSLLLPTKFCIAKKNPIVKRGIWLKNVIEWDQSPEKYCQCGSVEQNQAQSRMNMLQFSLNQAKIGGVVPK